MYKAVGWGMSWTWEITAEGGSRTERPQLPAILYLLMCDAEMNIITGEVETISWLDGSQSGCGRKYVRRDKGVPISGQILQHKALHFRNEFDAGDSDFTASVGWLDRLKKRYSINQLSVCGEKLSSNFEEMEAFKKIFQERIETYSVTTETLHSLARRSDEALGVRFNVARIAPSILDLGPADHFIHASAKWNCGIIRKMHPGDSQCLRQVQRVVPFPESGATTPHVSPLATTPYSYAEERVCGEGSAQSPRLCVLDIPRPSSFHSAAAQYSPHFALLDSEDLEMSRAAQTSSLARKQFKAPSDKSVAATHIKCAIAAKRKDLNLRAVV
ncbi:hypothetical protein PR048_007663 [Dryococelus australis]|uniref:HTH CENPB-type domain-containing protein n=1 Tax=Dryococelus australis TaxID=614101 RepID=A0ABQ9HUZ3_9NEOP|nr:hypothetical protein PR048_007663 [Dryococelus australis]